ncbi:Cysteine--tRNA ligase [Candidatus Magnetomoraceae bacterium gMMP-13]
MPLRIYNTLSKEKEVFESLIPGKVGMYVCGPTVYDDSHIGHARSVVVFDVITRYFKKIGFEVKYIRNFTDVDDKIINRAAELKMNPADLAEKYINAFYRDMDALYVQRAEFEPKATEHISDIIDIVKRLIEKNHAYEIDGDVYFSVESFDGYGKLSGRKLEDMEAGARVNVDERKHNPFDFALWKSAKPGEPMWESPWGKGRPGWHIECSAMSKAYLGESFDIHGGGKDLIFPHHENEIAQSEAASEKTFVKYWVHNGFVNIKQEKMSKSLGNFLMIKDVLKFYHPEVIRLFLLSKHYRSPIDFTELAMQETGSGLDRIYALLARLEKIIGQDNIQAEKTGKCWNRFNLAMEDDFNTAQGIGILFEEIHLINRYLDEHPSLSNKDKNILISERYDILHIASVLGILTESPDIYFDKKRNTGIEEKGINEAEIEKLIAERKEARKAKNWAKADELRDKLKDMGIIIEDRPEGTVWSIE